jgi:hypothetical protein
MIFSDVSLQHSRIYIAMRCTRDKKRGQDLPDLAPCGGKEEGTPAYELGYYQE